MRDYTSVVLAIVRKDILTEWRTREAAGSMALFSLLVVVIFGFCFETRKVDLDATAPGMLWTAFSFSGVLGLGHSFSSERHRGGLQALALAPIDRSAIFLGKMLGNLVLLSVVEAITIPVFSVLLHVPVAGCLPELALVTFTATIGFTAVGTLLSALATSSRMREMLLPILLYPIWIPILLAAVRATGGVLNGQSLLEVGGWMRLILGFDLIFVTAGILLFDQILEE
ncbi:MAG: heme exporter protein CcmB [Candidatus Eisenbacteria bacterium]|nr:heme exporter protein CcmB [Candidatus Eisenbacteria bacterium]